MLIAENRDGIQEDGIPEYTWTAILMKFGSREHLECFRSGTLYMRSTAYFSRLEHDAARSDPFDGTDQIHQAKDIIELRICNEATGREIDIPPDALATPMRLTHGRHNVFCMYSISERTDSGCPDIDQRNQSFGDSFCMVTNNFEFLRKIFTAIKQTGRSGEGRFVEYYDKPAYSGDTGPFRKPSDFSHQREFRIAVCPCNSDPLCLPVGDLTGVTTPIFRLAEINKIIRFPGRELA